MLVMQNISLSPGKNSLTTQEEIEKKIKEAQSLLSDSSGELMKVTQEELTLIQSGAMIVNESGEVVENVNRAISS